MTHEVLAHLILVRDYERGFRNECERTGSSLTITLGIGRGETSTYPIKLNWANDVAHLMKYSPTGWSIQMVSAKVFQLRGLATHEPLLVTWIGPF